MGGLVFRAALPELEGYKEYFSAFVTLGTPHIGYLTTNSKLLTAGMWIVGNWMSKSSIQEITFSDHKNYEEWTLHKLSKNKGLNWFDTGKQEF